MQFWRTLFFLIFRMLLTAPLKPSKSTTSRKTLPPTSRKSSTKSTTPLGIASSAGTLAPTSHTKPDTLSTSTWGRSPFCYSSLDKRHHTQTQNFVIFLREKMTSLFLSCSISVCLNAFQFWCIFEFFKSGWHANYQIKWIHD